MELAAEALATKISAYRALLDPPRRKIERRRWAEAQEAMGAKLHDFAMFSHVEGAEAHFLSAAALLETALKSLSQKADLARRIRLQMELGEVWSNLSSGLEGAAAIAARRRGAAIHEEASSALQGRKPQLRAQLLRRLGGVLSRLSEIEAGPEAREALLASARAYEEAIALEGADRARIWILRFLSASYHGLHRHAENAEEAGIWLRCAVKAMEEGLELLEPSGGGRPAFPDQAAWEAALAVGRGGGGAPLIWARFQDRLGDLLQELAALEKGTAAQAALRRAASAYEATLSLSEGRRSGSGWTETQDKLDKLRG